MLIKLLSIIPIHFPCSPCCPVLRRLLLYFSLFGFTLEPRCHRSRFKSPLTFLQHINFSSPSRLSSPTHPTSNPTRKPEQDLSCGNDTLSPPPPSRASSPLNSAIHGSKAAPAPTLGAASLPQNGPNTLHHRQKDPSTSDPLRKVTNHVMTNLRRIKSTQNHVVGTQKDKPTATSPSGTGVAGIRWNGSATIHQYSPERTLLLPCTPDEVREEVDVLLSDLIVRLKQLLFNSLLCAYYVGFIPMQFADVRNNSEWVGDEWVCG